MAINFNNTNIEAIRFHRQNSVGYTDITKVYFNDVLVWEQIQTQTLTLPIIQDPDGNYYNLTVTTTGGETLFSGLSNAVQTITITKDENIRIELTTLNINCRYAVNLVRQGSSTIITSYSIPQDKYGRCTSDTLTIRSSYFSMTADIVIEVLNYTKYNIKVSAYKVDLGGATVTLKYRKSSTTNTGVYNEVEITGTSASNTTDYYFIYDTLFTLSPNSGTDSSTDYFYNSLRNEYSATIYTSKQYATALHDDTVIYIRKYNYNYMTLTNNSKSGSTYSITINNPNHLDLTFTYNSLMSYSSDLRNWTGLSNLHNVTVNGDGSTTVSISENWFADAAGGSFVAGDLRYITYGNALSDSGAISLHYNQVSA